jgi:hypothetical protein
LNAPCHCNDAPFSSLRKKPAAKSNTEREREREFFLNPCEEKEEASPLVKRLSHKTSKTPPATLLIKATPLPTQQQQS